MEKETSTETTHVRVNKQIKIKVAEKVASMSMTIGEFYDQAVQEKFKWGKMKDFRTGNPDDLTEFDVVDILNSLKAKK